MHLSKTNTFLPGNNTKHMSTPVLAMVFHAHGPKRQANVCKSSRTKGAHVSKQMFRRFSYIASSACWPRKLQTCKNGNGTVTRCFIDGDLRHKPEMRLRSHSSASRNTTNAQSLPKAMSVICPKRHVLCTFYVTLFIFRTWEGPGISPLNITPKYSSQAASNHGKPKGKAPFREHVEHEAPWGKSLCKSATVVWLKIGEPWVFLLVFP